MHELRTLIIDIERLQGQATVRHHGVTTTGPFWDLSGWKWLNRRIHPDEVTSWPRSICAAWKWFGEDEKHFAAEWQPGRVKRFAKATWRAYDQADIVIGHNIRSFDTKHLNTLWDLNGLGAPSPYRQIDTLTEARKVFGDESKTLDALTRRRGLASKTDHYSVAVAEAACAGDPEAQQRLQGYNEGDIDATEAWYQRLQPWIKSHPHLNPSTAADFPTCHVCPPGTTLQRRGTYTPAGGVIVYLRYRCNGCGKWYRGASHSRGPATRAI